MKKISITNVNTQGGGRNSSIELLKIIAILLVIVSHICYSLSIKSDYYCDTGYILDLGRATSSPQQLLLTLLMYCGLLGNSIFFICSAWFFLDSTKAVSKKKISQFIVDVWFVSVSSLCLFLVFYKGEIPSGLAIKQLFPTLLCNNWFISCYILLYLIHPYLNLILKSMSQQELIRVILFMGVLYLGFGLIRSGIMFASIIIYWIAFYFIVAYFKLYLSKVITFRFGLKLFISALLLHCSIIIAMNCFSMLTGVGDGYLMAFRLDNNVLVFLIGFGLFIMAISKKPFKNVIINKCASCALLVYIIHENQLLRYLVRPSWWEYIFNNYGYDYVLFWVLSITAAVFIVSLLIALLYQWSIQKVTRKASDVLYSIISKFYIFFENKILTGKDV